MNTIAFIEQVYRNASFEQGIILIGLFVLCAAFFRTVLVLFLSVCVAFAIYSIQHAPAHNVAAETVVVQQSH